VYGGGGMRGACDINVYDVVGGRESERDGWRVLLNMKASDGG
jgi:hypothetical protein